MIKYVLMQGLPNLGGTIWTTTTIEANGDLVTSLFLVGKYGQIK